MNPFNTGPNRREGDSALPRRRSGSRFTWFGTRKTLTPQQKAQAADTFGAEGEFLSAGKKLIDTRHPDFKAVTGVRGRIVSYWRGISLPYPEPGIRLIRQDDIGPVNLQLTTLKADLQEAVNHLDSHFESLKSAAGERLGSLYNAGDYPQSLSGLFDVTWDFPSVEPRLPAAAQPRALRAGMPAGDGPVRRGGAVGRAGLFAGAVPARLAPE